LNSKNPESEVILKRASNELNAELTPGLIHEVNNILTGIYFNLETCGEALSADPALAESLSEMNQGVERVKEVLNRTVHIHLNVAEREKTYHDLESLVASQLDLLRIIFPKTAKISLISPPEALHVEIAEHPFRTVILTIASRLREIFPAGKVEVVFEILSTNQLAELIPDSDSTNYGNFVAVSLSVPCMIESVSEVDEYLLRSTTGDLTFANAENLTGSMGGRLLLHRDAAKKTSRILLLLPRIDLDA
jgi:signal transduction histidine kinase